jgi:EmrB/QacA subfamily drug resistance transporter
MSEETQSEPAKPARQGHEGGPLLILGLMLGILLAALDQTVVATSLPQIVADINGFEHFAWVFAAYMLGSTLVIPLAGKLSDTYGRRPIYLSGMGIFLIGSMLCGTSTDIWQLIAWRFAQGLGGGMIFPVAIAVVADIYAPTERGKIQGAFGAVFGLASVIGPFLGGAIVDNLHVFGIASWRWVFYVNIPLGAAAISVVWTHFPRKVAKETPPFDFIGTASLIAALAAALLVTVLGGATYAWASLQILALVALSVGAFVAFIFAEMRAKDPVVPLALFKNRVVLVSVIAVFLLGAGIFGVIGFFPAYLQGVVGFSATYSGATLIPLSLALIAGAGVSGFAFARVGYKPFALSGGFISAAGFAILLSMGTAPTLVAAILGLVIVGLGVGFRIQSYTLAVQNAADRKLIGTATSTVILFQTIGATFGVTILGVMLNNAVIAELPHHVPQAAIDGLLTNNFTGPYLGGHIERIPSLLVQPAFVQYANAANPALVPGIKDAFALAMGVIFLAGVIISLAAGIITIFLPKIKLKTREEYMGKPSERPGAPPAATPTAQGASAPLSGDPIGDGVPVVEDGDKGRV